VDGSKYIPLSVSAYPVAWKVEIVHEPKHLGFEYVRLCWENTVWSWAVSWGSKDNGAEVLLWTPEHAHDREPNTGLMWKLIPVESKDRGSPPSYEGDTVGQSCTCAQCPGPESDDLGTIVTEVTTVTTRRRYRVEGA